MRKLACSHAGRYSCARRRRERRCCSALRASAKPQSASGVFRRTAVSVSCTGFLERRCISTSPAATSGRPVCVGQRVQALDQQRVVGIQQQLDRDRRALGEAGLQPARLREQHLGRIFAARDQQRVAAGHAAQMRRPAVQVAHRQPVLALGAAQPRQRDQLAQVAIALAMARDQHQPARRRGALALQLEDAADQQLDRAAGLVLAFGLFMCAHHAGDRTFVGDRDRGIAQLRRACDQLFGMRGAGEEAEVGTAVQLCVGRQPLEQRRRGW